mgnify:CR=1 FL=1
MSALASALRERLDKMKKATERAVSLVDQLGDGLSSVYTFFDPSVAGMSYGTYNVLWQIEQTRVLQLPQPVPQPGCLVRSSASACQWAGRACWSPGANRP